MNEQIEFVKEIARRLDSAGIEYMFTGSIAMVFYAIDLFATDCYIDPASVKRAVECSGMFNIISNKLILKADFIVRKSEEYRRSSFRAASQ
ncbi:MAG: hypothetical protein KKB51_01930 [Candidatus Riflebacteria bacterium]|nr:hypothetical protein [Candidatus Riflebacteria bacterium]